MEKRSLEITKESAFGGFSADKAIIFVCLDCGSLDFQLDEKALKDIRKKHSS